MLYNNTNGIPRIPEHTLQEFEACQAVELTLSVPKPGSCIVIHMRPCVCGTSKVKGIINVLNKLLTMYKIIQIKMHCLLEMYYLFKRELFKWNLAFKMCLLVTTISSYSEKICVQINKFNKFPSNIQVGFQISNNFSSKCLCHNMLF